MGKQIILIRHGKSEWGNPGLDDADRPLNPRGRRNAPEMAQRLLQKRVVPQKMISSPALRALTTAKYFQQVWFPSEEVIEFNPAIYEANVTALLEVVNGLSNEYQSVALFGHNPGFTDFANYLSNANIYNIPTCGVVSMQFESDDWAEISAGTGTLISFDYPKSLDED